MNNSCLVANPNREEYLKMNKKIYLISIIACLIIAAYPVQGIAQAPEKPKEPIVSAENAIVIEESTGKILYEKNSRKLAYPASITKIMTALITIESGDLDRKRKVPDAAVGIEGSSIYLAAGERLSLRDLVYGLMLRSGNDAAVAISCLVDSSTSNFVDKMNARAKEIGVKNTNFVNPNGLFNENHYTTAYDMAFIAREAMKNEEFKEVAKAKSWVADRGQGGYNNFYNKNKVVFDYPGGTGIKIGYTIRSGRTLVASAERNGMSLICVVMRAPDWFNDSYKLMDYGFECFEMNKILEGQTRMKAIPVKNGNKDHVFIGLKDSISYPSYKNSDAIIEMIYRVPTCILPPVKRWQEAGSLEVYIDGSYASSHPLYFLEDIGLSKSRFLF